MFNAIMILMSEHRLIQKAADLLNEFKTKSSKGSFLDNFIDFFRTYADKRHHGKEEDILFKALKNKNMPENLAKIMQELLNEHKEARKLIRMLEKLKLGPEDKLQGCIEKIVSLYTAHIDKENHHFFAPAFNLFTEKEKTVLLKQFQDFDQKLTPQDYENMIDQMEKALQNS